MTMEPIPITWTLAHRLANRFIGSASTYQYQYCKQYVTRIVLALDLAGNLLELDAGQGLDGPRRIQRSLWAYIDCKLDNFFGNFKKLKHQHQTCLSVRYLADEIIALSNAFKAQYDPATKSIVLETKPFDVKVSRFNKTITIGPHALLISGLGDFHATPIAGKSTFDRNRLYYHPHINTHGGICFGDAAEQMHKLCDHGHLVDATWMAMATMANYNPDSPYCRIEQWLPEEYQPCMVCGNFHVPNTYRTCENPNCKASPICGSCVRQADDISACRLCVKNCSSCGARTLREHTYCRNCHAYYTPSIPRPKVIPYRPGSEPEQAIVPAMPQSLNINTVEPQPEPTSSPEVSEQNEAMQRVDGILNNFLSF